MFADRSYRLTPLPEYDDAATPTPTPTPTPEASAPDDLDADSDIDHDADTDLDDLEPRLIPFRRVPPIYSPSACPCCDGLGYKRFYDADCGWTHCACMACGGRATEGAFVLQVATPRFSHELSSFHTRDFGAALEKLARFATHLAGRQCLGHPAVEARLFFKHHDHDWRSPEGDAFELVGVVRLARHRR